MDIEKTDKTWDMIVIGGGITGAGVLREAVRMGLKTLLLEKNDYAWGTSSRSSKLVHGGLRYLKQGRIHLTRESVHQRQRLLREAPGLVDEIGFLMPIYKEKGPGRISMTAGLMLYDAMAGKRYHSYHRADAFRKMAPGIKTRGLVGGFRFMDAQTDDARLVLRLIEESTANGGAALNYTAVTGITRNGNGRVTGVTAEDAETGTCRVFSAPAVVNATGAWAESLHPVHSTDMHLRPLRGSHLVLPFQRLPLPAAVTLMHPDDGRPLFVIPWENALILGTTDVDHESGLNTEIIATRDEAHYMIECLGAYFPASGITLEDCVSSFAGIRPVLTRKENIDPSKESREHAIWSDNGLVTITGGKLTTFRVLAQDALKAASRFLPQKPRLRNNSPAFAAITPPAPSSLRGLPGDAVRRLYGRYGASAGQVISNASPEDLAFIPGTHTLWAELPWAAANGQVRHLTDLLLRRVRMGMLLSNGGVMHFERIRYLCAPHLPWNDERWRSEMKIYEDYWQYALSVPAA